MVMRHYSVFNMRHQQSGSTLLVSLIVMIILMLLGVTSMVTSNSQYRLTGNLQFENVAMNNAEAAITAAEVWLTTDTQFRDPGFTVYDADTPERYPIGTLAANGHLIMAWDDSDSMLVLGSTEQRYLIERMSTNNSLLGSSKGTGGRNSAGCNKVDTYRVTARGVGSRGATKFVQSYYSVTINHNDPDVKC